MENEIRTKQALIWKDEENIVHVKYEKGSKLGLSDAESVYFGIANLSKGLQVKLVIADITGIKSFNKGFRDYYDDKRLSSLAEAVATIVGSPLSKTLGNLYLKLNKPIFPIQLFTHESEAINWLQNYREKRVQ